MSERPPPQSLLEIAFLARRVHLHALRASIDSKQTDGSCAFGAYLLATLIRKFGQCSRVVIRGGDGVAGGYVSPGGIWYGHYWVEAQKGYDTFILDITADQFGDQSVVVKPIEEAPQYVVGNQAIVDAQMNGLLIDD